MKLNRILILFISIIMFCMPAFSKENRFVVKTGETFRIELDSNATTGYQWQIAQKFNTKIIKLVSSNYITPNTNLMGAGGKEIWIFEGVNNGETKIFLKYVRPWERVKPLYLKIYSVEVK